MNWLSPQEVEAWLADPEKASVYDRGIHWIPLALEQFVLALAEAGEDEGWHMCGCEIAEVARLLAGAMKP